MHHECRMVNAPDKMKTLANLAMESIGMNFIST